MRRLILIAFFSMAAPVQGWAQEPCNFGSENAFNAQAKDLSEAKSCEAAVKKMHDCAWGSSADTQLAPIAITKCEKTFFKRLSPAAQKHYAEEMQLCAYEYAGQEGTLYMSAAALCQMDVAARFAADLAAANIPAPRASFDCDKAQTPLEKAICSDISLGHADIVLSRVYSEFLKNSDEKDKSILVQSEKKWLQAIPAECGLAAAPFTRKSINCARTEFEIRFMTLDSCQEGIAWCLRDEDVPRKVPSMNPAPRASFDCEAPSTALEIVVCADADLGQMDIELAQAYRDAKAAMPPEQQKGLVDSERQWLRFVTGTCPLGVIGGIPSVMARSCVRSAFQVRIAQLQTCPRKELQQRTSCLNDFRLFENK